MIKARAVAGDPAVGADMMERLRPFVWRKYLDFAAIQDIQSIKRQVAVEPDGRPIDVAGHDIERGRGGIRPDRTLRADAAVDLGRPRFVAARARDLRCPALARCREPLQRRGSRRADRVVPLSPPTRATPGVDRRRAGPAGTGRQGRAHRTRSPHGLPGRGRAWPMHSSRTCTQSRSTTPPSSRTSGRSSGRAATSCSPAPPTIPIPWPASGAWASPMLPPSRRRCATGTTVASWPRAARAPGNS